MPPEVGAKKPLPETAIAAAKDLEKIVPLVDVPDAAEDLGGKLAKLKSLVLKLDAFKRELPRDIPKDHYFMTYSGVTLSFIFYILLGLIGAWIVTVIEESH